MSLLLCVYVSKALLLDSSVPMDDPQVVYGDYGGVLGPVWEGNASFVLMPIGRPQKKYLGRPRFVLALPDV